MSNKIRQNAPLIVLKALLNGAEIPHYPWPLILEEGRLMYLTDEDTAYQADLTFNSFLQICEKMSEEDIVGLAASNALRSIKK
jgi:hypothetical protein